MNYRSMFSERVYVIVFNMERSVGMYCECFFEFAFKSMIFIILKSIGSGSSSGIVVEPCTLTTVGVRLGAPRRGGA